MITVRFFDSADGEMYHVSLAPLEGPSGVNHMLKAVVFETAGGRWVGSTPMYGTVTMEQLKHEDLQQLLKQAIGRESFLIFVNSPHQEKSHVEDAHGGVATDGWMQ